MANEKHQPATHNPILRFTLYAQLTTRNPQPISGLTPLLLANFTLYALRITLFLVPRPSPLVPFRYVIFVTVNSKMAKMAGK
jgi:hypothetical protein